MIQFFGDYFRQALRLDHVVPVGQLLVAQAEVCEDADVGLDALLVDLKLLLSLKVQLQLLVDHLGIL